MEAPFNLDTKGVSAERSAAALKNHSDAERRRRARINAHLGSLRSLVPGGKKVGFFVLYPFLFTFHCDSSLFLFCVHLEFGTYVAKEVCPRHCLR